MSRLDRYIFRAALLPFLLILVCTTAVAWLTQVLQRMDIIVDDGGTLAAFLKITVLLIPSLVGIVIPVALFAACLYVLNVLMVDSEIPVMRAAGASRFRIARPLLLLGILAAGAVYIINLDLQPRSYRQLRETVWDVRSNIASSLVRDQVFARVTSGVTFYAEDVRPGDQYVGVHIHDERNPERPVTYTAENGLFTQTEAGPRLYLLKGTAQWPDPETGEIEIVRFDNTNVGLEGFTNGRPVNKPWETSERYLGELFNPDLNRPYNQEHRLIFLAEAHARLATPLYSIAFVLIAAVFMLTATTSRRGYGQRILYASAVAGLIRILGFVAQSLASDNPSLNWTQYAVPISAIVIASLALMNPRSFSLQARRAPEGQHDLFGHAGARA
ncbi:LptF/LptG family permease [Parvularcula lutaonensis]|uniref:LptF/LptG family permease n=1 Tax=Parvularcula lutaonensis TaxID=491923 RepID=A0ABV7MAZ9_9PROT|nr:LptF/LptG family permease [Parvularcula lutaonensis]GGY39104.1 LPS export ABC transporter permease LptF [Parvularcula lutaonensis]